ncbi:MAG: helix-turn-helix transcriptional regulator [Deltaproteobacteria bacterium]|nr:helix-turn-helix transcriptional regulator [Deltaproteobacteria bacterium]
MRKTLTEVVQITIEGKRPRLFLVPKEKARSVANLIEEFESNTVSLEDAFKDLYDKFSRAGTTLHGFRLRDSLTQEELAKILVVKQSHISEMERGVRPIGKQMAMRLAKVFKTDYRSFLTAAD